MVIRKAFHQRIKRIGYFGKVPSIGDFVSRNVTLGLRDGFDVWLKQALDSSKNQLKESWLNAFLTSPIWRLVLDRQLEADAIIVGIMIPSVDKVGRYFPFCIFVQMERIELDATVLSECDTLLDGLEDLILTILEPDFDLEYFDYRLASIAKKLTAVDQLASGHSDAAPSVKDSGNFFEPKGFDQLSSRISELQAAGGSVWWSEGSDWRGAGIHIYNSMPPATTFAAFLRDADTFSEFEQAWDYARNLSITQSNNPSVDFGGKGAGFKYHAIAHEGRNQIANTGYASAFSHPLNPNMISGVILSDGQFGVQSSAMVSRIICKMLPTFLSFSGEPAVKLKNVDRLIGFLQFKLPQAQKSLSFCPFGFCCVYVTGNSDSETDTGQPIAVHIISTSDYVCFHVKDGQLTIIFKDLESAEDPTVLHNEKNFFKSTTVLVSSGERLFFGYGLSNTSDSASTLTDPVRHPSPQDSAKSIFQNAMISGRLGNISMSILDF